MNFSILSDIKEDLWTYLSKTSKPIIMYGTGNGADKIIDVLENRSISLYGIFASDDFARGQNFRGFTVKKYSDFCAELSDFIVLVSFASQKKEVLENIYRIAKERELYAPDVPVYGEGLFDIEYFELNKSKLKNVFERLADDLSRKTFVSTLAYKLTGKISYLAQCESNEDETFALISKMNKCKNYIDIGAYTGDTVEEYVKRFGSNMYIYAFEPDEKNFRKMTTRFENLGISVSSFNSAAWDNDETLSFCSVSGRSSSLENALKSSKTKDILAMRIDNHINDEIGYIKIDAEGSDVKVLCGLKKIIKNSKPCIKVAAYHRNDDYFSIPECVSEICDNYKLYMRHLPYVPAWDTDFIFEF